MEIRLKGVEKTLKMHLKVLKTRRTQQLILVSEKRAALQDTEKKPSGPYVLMLRILFFFGLWFILLFYCNMIIFLFNHYNYNMKNIIVTLIIFILFFRCRKSFYRFNESRNTNWRRICWGTCVTLFFLFNSIWFSSIIWNVCVWYFPHCTGGVNNFSHNFYFYFYFF